MTAPSETEPAPAHHASRGVGISMILVAGLTLASNIAGFLREIMVGRTFGATGETDAFFAAFTLVAFCALFFSAGTVQGALMPAYQMRLEESDGARGAGLLRWALLRTGFVALLLTCLLIVFAKPLTQTLFPGFGEAKSVTATLATRVLAPTVLLAALGAVAQSVFHADRRFVVPALVPIAMNAMVIVTLLLAAGTLGVLALSTGFLLGHLPWLLLLAAVAHRFKERGVASADPARRTVLAAFSFLAGMIIFDQVSALVQRSVLSQFDDGVLSAFAYGTRLAGLPVGIIAGALAVVLFPRLVTETLVKGHDEPARVVLMGLAATLSLLAPVAVFLALEPRLIVTTLFGSGAFTPEAVELTAQVLVIYALSLPAQALILFLIKVYIAATRVRSLLVVGAVSGIAQIMLTIVAARHAGWIGVPLATLAYAYLHAILLLGVSTWFLAISFWPVLLSLGKVALASALGCLVWVLPLGDGLVPALLRGVVMTTLYVGLLYAFNERSVFTLFRERA